jgi:hypothetical protein
MFTFPLLNEQPIPFHVIVYSDSNSVNPPFRKGTILKNKISKTEIENKKNRNQPEDESEKENRLLKHRTKK